MNICGTSKMTVVSKTSQPSKDGTQTFYKLGVLVGSEVGMLSCSKDIYDIAEAGKTYDFGTQYNDNFKSFRLTGITSSK